jgi:hypothetical protein
MEGDVTLGCRHGLRAKAQIITGSRKSARIAEQIAFMTTKAQHTVPRLHLQHFAGNSPAGQVWTYDSQTGKSWSQIPEETGITTHFYSLERDDGTQDTRIEEMLSEIESRAAPVYEALLRGIIPAINTQERVHFAEFLAMQFVRTTGMRRMSAEIHSHGLQSLCFAYAQHDGAFETLIRGVEKQRGKTMDDATKDMLREGLRDPSRFDIEVPKHLTIKALGAADALSPIFYNMKWSIAQPIGGYFITGDAPVIRTTDPKTRHPVMGDHGFNNRTAETSFPLSPQTMLLTSWDADARDHGLFEKEHVDALNELRAIHSERFLYTHVNDASIAELSKRFLDSSPKLKTSGFGPKKLAETKVGRR